MRNTTSNSPVIFISGGTGIGTSTLAYSLVPIVGAHALIGTDSIRQILRSLSDKYTPEEQLYLKASSFAVHNKISFDNNLSLEDRIIYGYQRQSEIVMKSALAVAYRALSEGYPLILEGVHISYKILSQLIKMNCCNLYNLRKRFFKVFLHCEDATQHMKHFFNDVKHSSRDSTSTYTNDKNWGAIRIIQNNLHKESKRNRIHSILDNGKYQQYEVVEKFAKDYFLWKSNLI